MWLRFVLVGAMAVTGGLIQLVVGEAINLAAPAFVGGGAVLMAFASWRVRSLLGDAGPPTVEPVIVRRTVLAAE